MADQIVASDIERWDREDDGDAEAVLTRILGVLGAAAFVAVVSMAAMIVALVYVVRPWVGS